VPPAVDAIVRKMMAKKPEQRYQTLAAVAADLAAVLASGANGTGAIQSAGARAVPLLDVRLTHDPPGALLTPARPARHWPWVVAVVAVAALVAPLLLWWQWPTSDVGTPRDEPALPVLPALDRLGAAAIPEEDRFGWQPRSLVAVLGEHRGRIWGVVGSVAFSGDGKRIATLGHDGRTWLFDAATGNPLSSIPGKFESLLLSPTGAVLVAAPIDTERPAQLWDLGGVEPKQLGELPGAYRLLAFSRDGKRLLATGSGGEKGRVWDLASPRPAPGPVLPATMSAAAFIEKERLVTCDNGGRHLQVWNLTASPSTSRPIRLPRQYGEDWQPQLSADGALLCLASARQTHCWRLPVPGDRPLAELAVGRPWEGVRFAPDGKTLLAVVRGTDLMRYSLDSQSEPKLLVKGLPSSTFALSADGKALAVADGTAVRVWDLSASPARERWPARGMTRPVEQVAFLPDGKSLAVLAATSGEGKLSVWDVSEKPAHQVREAVLIGFGSTFSPDGTRLATRQAKGVQVYAVDREPIRELFARPIPHQPVWLAFSGDGRRLAGGCQDDRARVWELSGTGWKDSFDVPRPTEAGFVALNHDGSLLATGGGLYRQSGKQIRKLHGSFGVEFRPRSGELVVANAKATRLEKAIDGKKMWSIEPEGRMTFSPDGQRLALWVAHVGQVRVINPDRPKQQTFTCTLPGRIGALAFSDDGRHLALGNSNGTVYVLRLEKKK
jgi:WD40 repeat protein